MTPEIMVINLDRSPDRLAFMRGQLLERLGLPFTRLPATDADHLGEAEFERLANRWQRPLRRSEVACLVSHSCAWKHCAESGRPLLVLEDDMVLSEQLPDLLAGLPDAAEWDYINVESRNSPKQISRLPVSGWQVKGVGFHSLFVDRGGAGGYLLAPAGAQKLLDHLESRAAPADAYLNQELGLRRYQTDPGLARPAIRVGQTGRRRLAFQSTIDHTPRSFVDGLKLFLFQPKFKLRRIAGFLDIGWRQLAALPVAVRRSVPPCPTILDKLSNGNA